MEQLRRLILCAALILSAYGFTHARTAADALANNCDLPLEKAPELWGFRLGMTVDELKARYPTVNLSRQDSFGLMTGVIYAVDANKAQKNYKWLLSGVSSVSLDFIDGKLSYVGVLYGLEFNFPDVDSYTTRLSNDYKMPFAWQPSKDLSEVREMRCTGFDMFAFVRYGTAFGLFDAAATSSLDKRVNDYRQGRYKSFRR